MKTRRSPRNQERLWRALGPPTPVVPVVPETGRCFDCASYPRGGRARGACTVHGVVVRGMSERACFVRHKHATTARQLRAGDWNDDEARDL